MYKNKRGAAIIEYALIASLIAVVAIVAMNRVGGAVKAKMNVVADELDDGDGGGSVGSF